MTHYGASDRGSVAGDRASNPAPETMVRNALCTGRVVRCQSPDGPKTDYLSVGGVLPMAWVAWRETDAEAHIVHRDAVVRHVRDAMPAVYTVAKDRSRWGSDR